MCSALGPNGEMLQPVGRRNPTAPTRAQGQTEERETEPQLSVIAPFNPHLSVPELALALGRGRSRVADELALEFAVSKRASAHPGT